MALRQSVMWASSLHPLWACACLGLTFDALSRGAVQYFEVVPVATSVTVVFATVPRLGKRGVGEVPWCRACSLDTSRANLRAWRCSGTCRMMGGM